MGMTGSVSARRFNRRGRYVTFLLVAGVLTVLAVVPQTARSAEVGFTGDSAFYVAGLGEDNNIGIRIVADPKVPTGEAFEITDSEAIFTRTGFQGGCIAASNTAHCPATPGTYL